MLAPTTFHRTSVHHSLTSTKPFTKLTILPDHCLETLRQRLICQPDLGVRAVAWDPSIGPTAVKANNTVNAECVDWGAVQEWTRQHTFSPHDGLITQPDGKSASIELSSGAN